MRIFLTAVLTALIVVTLGSEAQAKRGGVSIYTEGKLLFVADTKLPSPDGGALTLCTLVKQRSIAGLANIWISAQSYAFAGNRCDVDQYLPLDARMVSEAIQMGAIPPDVPVEPNLSLVQIFKGAWLTVLFAALMIFAVIQKIRGVGTGPAQAHRG